MLATIPRVSAKRPSNPTLTEPRRCPVVKSSTLRASTMRTPASSAEPTAVLLAQYPLSATIFDANESPRTIAQRAMSGRIPLKSKAALLIPSSIWWSRRAHCSPRWLSTTAYRCGAGRGGGIRQQSAAGRSRVESRLHDRHLIDGESLSSNGQDRGRARCWDRERLNRRSGHQSLAIRAPRVLFKGSRTQQYSTN